MTYITLKDGFTVGLDNLLGLATAALGLVLVYVYYTNPGDMLTFETRE